MGDDQRFEKWASGILGVVSLLLILNLGRVYTSRWRAVFPEHLAAPHSERAAKVARLAPRQSHPLGPAHKLRQAHPQASRPLRQKEVERGAVDPAGSIPHSARAKRNPRPAAEATRSVASAARLREASPHSMPTLARAMPRPAPKPSAAQPAQGPRVTELQSIGYVEKADGTRQAAVSEGNRVFLVEEGQTFDDHYRVLKISPSTVEVADLAAAPAVEAPGASAGPAVAARQSASAPAGEPSRAVDPMAPEASVGLFARPSKAQNVEARRLADSVSRPAIPAEAEARADRPAEADSRRVKSPTDVSSPGITVRHLAAAAEHDKMSTSRTQSEIPAIKLTLLTSNNHDSVPERLGFVEWAGNPPETIVAEGDQIRLVPNRTEVAQNSGAGIPEQPPSGEAAAMNDPSEIVRYDSGTTAARPESPASSKPPPAALDAYLAAEPKLASRPFAGNFGLLWNESGGGLKWHPPPDYFNQADAAIREVSTRAGPLSRFASRAGPDAAAIRNFKAFCFVEKEDGSREAFIALGGEVYLVHEGEVFANRYRVLKIAPLSVVAADERAEQNASPPNSGPELVRNHGKLPDPIKLAGGFSPETLPLVDTVRSLAAVSADPEAERRTPGLGRTGIPGAIPSKPTLPDGGPSTSSVPVPGLNRPSASLPGPPDSDLARKAGDESGARIAPRPAVAPLGKERVADFHASHARRFGIIPLPLEASRELAELPVLPLGGVFSGSLAGTRRVEGQTGRGLTRSAPLVRSGKWPAGQASASAVSRDGIASLAVFPSSSGEGLHLDFSIGDNGCYFPR